MQEVVGSNPGTRYWMDFIRLDCGKSCIVFLKRPKDKRKRGQEGPFFFQKRVMKYNLFCKKYSNTQCSFPRKELFKSAIGLSESGKRQSFSHFDKIDSINFRTNFARGATKKKRRRTMTSTTSTTRLEN